MAHSWLAIANGVPQPFPLPADSFSFCCLTFHSSAVQSIPSEKTFASGVGHVCTAPAKRIERGRPSSLLLVICKVASGVGQLGETEPPLPLVRSSDLGRLEHRPFRIVPESGHASEYNVHSANRNCCDVLQKHPAGFHIANDPLELEPESAAIAFFDAFAFPRLGDVDAGESARNHLNMASPGSRVESVEIRPDRRIIQGAVLHARDQDFAGKRFDLDITPTASSWASESDGGVEHSDAAAQADVISDGRYVHIIYLSGLKIKDRWFKGLSLPPPSAGVLEGSGVLAYENYRRG